MAKLNFMQHQTDALNRTEQFDMGLGKTFVGAEKNVLNVARKGENV